METTEVLAKLTRDLCICYMSSREGDVRVQGVVMGSDYEKDSRMVGLGVLWMDDPHEGQLGLGTQTVSQQGL